MSRAAQKSPAVRHGSLQRRAPALCAERVEVLVLTWSVSRRAAAARGLAQGPGGGSPVLEIRTPWRDAVRRVDAAIVDDGTRRVVEAAGGGEWLHDRGLWHLDILGVVSVSLREERGAIRVLYARCELPARLGLEGGRYEFEGAAVVTA